MKDHEFILMLFLIPAIGAAILFYIVYRSSLRPKLEEGGMKKPTVKRFYFFILLASVLIIFLSVTIPKSPYFRFANDSPSKVIYVTALQFAYVMSIDAENAKQLKGDDSVIFAANQVVEFRVTSQDVTHGFAIYNSKAELVTQVQAMPGYVNRLRWKFTEPGNYELLCLEFCGAGHAFMRSSFTVK